MLDVSNVTLQFGGRVLFKNVTVSFQKGHNYGIIGANGAGKTTFLKILSGEIEPNKGEVIRDKKERMSILSQDQHAFDRYTVLDTVLLGYPYLKELRQRLDELYAKPDFSDKDGILAANLEIEYGELGGYESEANARSLLSALGIRGDLQEADMAALDGRIKVKVLLAQALFGNPDILILDEPTNNLDAIATRWLENFLYNFNNTVIIVSHDRHFLNKVCTRILDIDFEAINLYVGNYDFWYESSQLAQRQMKESNSKKEVRMKQLEDFIARFSANASKSRQATSRKRELEKITLDDIRPSSRRYPFIDFKYEKELGNNVLEVTNLTKKSMFHDISFTLNRKDKVAFIAPKSTIITTLFKILSGEIDADSGSFKFGITAIPTFMNQDYDHYFKGNENLVDWLRPYSKDQAESYLRGWLGRMLFSGDEALKKVKVLSGGEKARCMFARSMLTAGNILVMDEPTNHLDLETITALNKGLENYRGALLLASKDHELLATVANRVIYIDGKRIIDKKMNYEEFIDWADTNQIDL